MTEQPQAIRASDADRDAAAEALADAVATGRLTLADHNTRLDALFAAVTTDQLAAVTAGLPARPARRTALFRAFSPYRCTVIGGRAQRAGRFRIGRFCTVVAAFGGLDLDLRAARPGQDEIGLTIWSVAARVTVTVPAGWRVTDQVLALGSRQVMDDRDGPPGAPLLRVSGCSLGGSYRLSQD